MARSGFYTRLRELEPPAMFVWGDEDPLVPLAFSRYVRDALPDARQVVLEQCGHVPQVEHPVDANALVHDFIGRAQASRPSAPRSGSAGPPAACRSGSTRTAGTAPAQRQPRRDRRRRSGRCRIAVHTT